MCTEYPPKCDICGKFFSPALGGSWLDIPACDIPGETGEERERCYKCTEEYGPLAAPSKYRQDLVCGKYSD